MNTLNKYVKFHVKIPTQLWEIGKKRQGAIFWLKAAEYAVWIGYMSCFFVMKTISINCTWPELNGCLLNKSVCPLHQQFLWCIKILNESYRAISQINPDSKRIKIRVVDQIILHHTLEMSASSTNASTSLTARSMIQTVHSFLMRHLVVGSSGALPWPRRAKVRFTADSPSLGVKWKI